MPENKAENYKYPSGHFIRNVRKEMDQGNSFVIEVQGDRAILYIKKYKFLFESDESIKQKGLKLKEVIGCFFVCVAFFRLFFVDLIADVLEYRKEFREQNKVLLILYRKGEENRGQTGIN